jgi:hypothetical protein
MKIIIIPLKIIWLLLHACWVAVMFIPVNLMVFLFLMIDEQQLAKKTIHLLGADCELIEGQD